MIKYFTSTTLLLVWCVIFSLALIPTRYSLYWRFGNSKTRTPDAPYQLPLIPSLVIAPLMLVGAYSLFKWNLIYPIASLATFDQLVLATVAPGFVLFVSSGLAFRIFSNLRRECDSWTHRTFVTVASAYGHSPASSIRRVVYCKTFLDSWTQCLPWLFGELLVVEAVFNAPGLGTDAWHQARMRQFPELFESVFWLFVLYFTFTALSHFGNQWLGKRLENYG